MYIQYAICVLQDSVTKEKKKQINDQATFFGSNS